MAGKFTVNETLNTLRVILEKHKEDRVCVIGTTCAGKSTLLNQLPEYNCEDLDEVLWPNIPEEEKELMNHLLKMPWTTELGNEIDRLVYKFGRVKPGYPLFSTVILDCEAVVYLDISDELLAAHCEKRGVGFEDSKNIKEAIEGDWNNHKLKNDKIFYYLTVTE